MDPVVTTARRPPTSDRRIAVVLDPLFQIFTVQGLDQLHDVAVTCDDAIARLVRSSAA